MEAAGFRTDFPLKIVPIDRKLRNFVKKIVVSWSQGIKRNRRLEKSKIQFSKHLKPLNYENNIQKSKRIDLLIQYWYIE